MTDRPRIRTTHTGSLPRPAALTEMLIRHDRGQTVAGLGSAVREATAEVVARQIDLGLDVINDGEAGRLNYTTYVTGRLAGFDGKSEEYRLRPPGWEEFPGFFARASKVTLERPACTSRVEHVSLAPVAWDVENLASATRGRATDDVFMSCASPGTIAIYLPDRHYNSHEDYIWALADAMQPEYEAIHAAGFLLQLDCPDLTLAHAPGQLELHVEAINHATRRVPPERMRLHICWGNYEGPHNHDVPLEAILEPVLRARPAALSFEAANPRHEHEWRVFDGRQLPEDKVLIPGVIDSTTNYIEHPRVVADRILRYARLVGPQRMLAGTDCGFATTASHLIVDPEIAWAKLRALAEGAALASAELGDEDPACA